MRTVPLHMQISTQYSSTSEIMTNQSKHTKFWQMPKIHDLCEYFCPVLWGNFVCSAQWDLFEVLFSRIFTIVIIIHVIGSIGNTNLSMWHLNEPVLWFCSTKPFLFWLLTAVKCFVVAAIQCFGYGKLPPWSMALADERTKFHCFVPGNLKRAVLCSRRLRRRYISSSVFFCCKSLVVGYCILETYIVWWAILKRDGKDIWRNMVKGKTNW